MNSHGFWRRLGMALGGAALLWSAACTKPDDAPVVVAGSPTVAAEVGDIEITTHVMTALRQDEMLKDFTIEVHTTKGDVRMTGAVDTQQQADQVERLARAATGVHAIHNEVTVRP